LYLKIKSIKPSHSLFFFLTLSVPLLCGGSCFCLISPALANDTRDALDSFNQNDQGQLRDQETTDSIPTHGALTDSRLSNFSETLEQVELDSVVGQVSRFGPTALPSASEFHGGVPEDELTVEQLEAFNEFTESVQAALTSGGEFESMEDEQNVQDLGLEGAEILLTAKGAKDVCLPRQLDDCFDSTDPDCWEDPQPRAAGWGCGGVRMRLSCEPTWFQSVEAFRDLRPVIVGK